MCYQAPVEAPFLHVKKANASIRNRKGEAKGRRVDGVKVGKVSLTPYRFSFERGKGASLGF